jgi:hypothetical protein
MRIESKCPHSGVRGDPLPAGGRLQTPGSGGGRPQPGRARSRRPSGGHETTIRYLRPEIRTPPRPRLGLECQPVLAEGRELEREVEAPPGGRREAGLDRREHVFVRLGSASDGTCVLSWGAPHADAAPSGAASGKRAARQDRCGIGAPTPAAPAGWLSRGARRPRPRRHRGPARAARWRPSRQRQGGHGPPPPRAGRRRGQGRARPARTPAAAR